ncbi:MAG: hypothetical protein Q4F58_03450 [Candidatus Saccharibacteria bacterium]|nr:hypothetical protein [Candidatus Saccharibacteria bacterium]
MLIDEKKTILHDSLLKKTEELGREPTYSDVLLDERMPHPNDYAYDYGSFSDAVKEVWEEYSFKGKTAIKIKKPINNLGRNRA